MEGNSHPINFKKYDLTNVEKEENKVFTPKQISDRIEIAQHRMSGFDKAKDKVAATSSLNLKTIILVVMIAVIAIIILMKSGIMGGAP